MTFGSSFQHQLELHRKLNFSGGPGELPEVVLEEASHAVMDWESSGLSILGLSHRSDAFAAILAEARGNIADLLRLPSGYSVVFVQGGGSLQFAMVPMHFLSGTGRTAEYIVGGYWSQRAIDEARTQGPVTALWDGQQTGYRTLPRARDLTPSPDAAYLHYVSNETVEGLQFQDIPGLDAVPRMCDMSSDFLSRRVDMSRFDLVYAHAQKNLGIAGVTLVVLNDRVLERERTDLPRILRYRTHVESGSIFHTPPVFAIYTTLLVSRWLKGLGGLDAMAALNERKSALLYELLDARPDVFAPHALPGSRSHMNVAFRLVRRELEPFLLEEAEAEGMYGLAGHRSLGGFRVSLYNAVTEASVRRLVDFLLAWCARTH